MWSLSPAVAHINCLQHFLHTVLVFFPLALITPFNLLPNLHYLIVFAVRLSDVIDNAHYATLTCTATAGNQISHFHFPIAFLLIIAELQPLHPSHPSIQLSVRECLPSDSLPLTEESGIPKGRVQPVKLRFPFALYKYHSNQSVG